MTNGLSQRQTKVAMKQKKRRRILQCRKAKAQWKGIGICQTECKKKGVLLVFPSARLWFVCFLIKEKGVSFNGQKSLNQYSFLTQRQRLREESAKRKVKKETKA